MRWHSLVAGVALVGATVSRGSAQAFTAGSNYIGPFFVCRLTAAPRRSRGTSSTRSMTSGGGGFRSAYWTSQRV